MPDWFRPIQFTIGDDCLTCHGAGTTPKHFYVSFTGIMKGDDWIGGDGEPPNGLYDITQHGVNPCHWFLTIVGGPRVYYYANPADTILHLVYRHPLFAFKSKVLTSCRGFHFNNLDVAAGNHFYGGHAIVFTPAMIQAIIESHTPVVDPDPLFKVSPMAGELSVISYIDDWGDTKFKMKVVTDF